jgi:hypothetical protein
LATRLFSFSDAINMKPAAGSVRYARMVEAKVYAPHMDVFLSHSTTDDLLVPGVVAFFQTYGASVYADDFDQRLPKPPTSATAQIIKSEIGGSRRLVVLATPRSHTSRWIPWELGIGDGLKGIPPNAVLPITPEGEVQAWTTIEYFALYPKIVNQDGAWHVTDPRGTSSGWPLATWLSLAKF